jgi:6-phosphofructokinase 1
MRIGILTSGGDCPGINATIRGVCKTAIHHYGMEVLGIHSGFRGLLDKEVEVLTDKSLSGLLSMGGTILGTSREKPFKKKGLLSGEDKPALLAQNIQELGLDCVVCIGGNGTQKTAAKMAQMGLNVVSVPKTIDNDVWGTDTSFGFDSAVTIATDAIDRLHSTASSHQRVMVIEVMGHKAGWIALHSGMAGGGDVILLPEIPYDIHRIGNTIIERLKRGKTYSIVVVAEGIQTADGKKAAEYIAQEIEYETGIETRETVLGYIQRGGSPTPFDRNLWADTPRSSSLRDSLAAWCAWRGPASPPSRSAR